MFDIEASIAVLDEKKEASNDESRISGSIRNGEQYGLSTLQFDEFVALRNYRKCFADQAVLHDDAETVYRFLRDGQTVLHRNEHPSYRECKCEWARILRERELKMIDDIRLSGQMQNFDHEDFMKLFNMDVNERLQYKDKILEFLFCKDQTPVSELKKMGEEGAKILNERIFYLEQVKNMLLVWLHKDTTTKIDILEELSDEEKKRIRESDKKYKPKPQPKPEDKKATVRKSQNDKMRATLRAMAPADLQGEGKEKELEDWIDKFIIANRK